MSGTLLPLLALSLLVAPQTAAPTPTPGVYRDTVAHFSFEFPLELTVDRAASQTAVPNARKTDDTSQTKRALDCLVVPLVAAENRGTPKFGVVILTRLDLTCTKERPKDIKLDDLTLSALETALKMLGQPVMSTATAYRLAGHATSVATAQIDAQTSKSKAPIFGQAICSLIEKDVVCWSVMGADQERVRQIVGGNITFDGKMPEPLVPAAILNK